MWENMQELVPLSYLRLLPLPPAVMKDKSGQDIPIITSGRIHVGSENGAAGFHLAGRTTVYSWDQGVTPGLWWCFRLATLIERPVHWFAGLQ